MKKRQQQPAGDVVGAPAKAARGGGSGTATLAEGSERAVLPSQPTAGCTTTGQLLPGAGGRVNACWAPPVVAIASFYRVTGLPGASQSSRAWPAGAGDGEITVDSILGLRAGDDAEEACEVFEDITGWWLPETTWGNDEASIKDEPDLVWGGPTSVSDFGTHAVGDEWWAALTRTIENDDLVLLLVERLEGGKDKGHMHYLLVLGFEEQIRRRGGNVRRLWLKDPMEGNELLEAEFWAEPKVELITKQASGKPLDRYTILEATHLKAPPMFPGAAAEAEAPARGAAAAAPAAAPARAAAAAATTAPALVAPAAGAAAPPTAAAPPSPAPIKRVLMIRHGQSVANAESKRTPRVPDHLRTLDELLTEQGLRQALSWAELSPSCGVGVCLVSPLARAMQTADAVFRGTYVPMELLPAIRERWWPNGGSFQSVGAARSTLESWSSSWCVGSGLLTSSGCGGQSTAGIVRGRQAQAVRGQQLVPLSRQT